MKHRGAQWVAGLQLGWGFGGGWRSVHRGRQSGRNSRRSGCFFSRFAKKLKLRGIQWDLQGISYRVGLWRRVAPINVFREREAKHQRLPQGASVCCFVRRATMRVLCLTALPVVSVSCC